MRTIHPYYRALGTTRVARQVSGLHTLFVGPAACARHGFYANAHLHADYISYLTTSLLDVSSGRLASLVVEAAREVVAVRSPRIEALMLYSGCEDELVCTDFASIARAVEDACGVPVVHFGKNRMFVEGRGSFFPTFYRSLFELLEPVGAHDSGVNLIGSISALRPGNDFEEVLTAAGLGPVRTLKTARTFADFRAMAASGLNVVIDEDFREAACDMRDRLGIPFVYLPLSYDPREVGAAYDAVGAAFCADLGWRPRYERACYVARAAASAYPAPFVLDAVGVGRPIACVRALVGMGFAVDGVVTMVGDRASEHGCGELTEIRRRRPGFQTISYDYKAHMPVVEELAPLEAEFYGFAALEHIAGLVAGEGDYT